jgi:signal peptidase I
MKNYRYLERRNMMIRRIGLWVGEVVAAILLAFLVIQFCFQTVTVHGDSMQPAYYDGDSCIFTSDDENDTVKFIRKARKGLMQSF